VSEKDDSEAVDDYDYEEEEVRILLS
jgi:hypothetical protein